MTNIFQVIFSKSMEILKKEFTPYKSPILVFLRIPVDFKKYPGKFDTGILTLLHGKICEINKWPFQEV